jgi:hypothetical protein
VIAADPKILHNVAASSVFERALINESELVSGGGERCISRASASTARFQRVAGRDCSFSGRRENFIRSTSSSVRARALGLKNVWRDVCPLQNDVSMAN